MNREIGTKWLSALRSGEYQQTTNYLHVIKPRTQTPEHIGGPTKPGHCCLGVLCEVALKEGVQLQVDVEHLGEKTTCDEAYVKYDTSESYLPERVEEWAGICRDPNGDQTHLMGKIVEMNDTGILFQGIADFIEAHMDEL